MTLESTPLATHYETDDALIDLHRALRALDERVRAELDLRPLLYRRAGSLLFVGLGLGLILGSRPRRMDIR